MNASCGKEQNVSAILSRYAVFELFWKIEMGVETRLRKSVGNPHWKKMIQKIFAKD
ncbi:hypothetical protein LEP1GSC125_1354 [Leptospira mayottensis 200901122]|uniref:Uncharacterized protein n=1 Tax=Leptospira mayottensis 200901122 TaxID=1193010 RepID=A0AA87MQR5_9LEPT|nr:hypothetical protein LEP1GSC125_1354 [Leptospira mayottensis 200901122]